MTTLEELSPLPLRVVWHENKSIYLSVRKERGCLFMRVHRLFYNAPTPVLEALIKYAMKRDPESRAIVKQMAHLHFSTNRAKAEPLESAGVVYDLNEIFSRLQKSVPVDDVSIGWSDRSSKGKFRSITFGTFDKHRRQIRINRLLDNPQVPLYFLEYIVYHEMLHAVCPTRIDRTGRCTIHTKEFREREKLFPHFEAARKWEKTSLTFFKTASKKRKSHGRS